MTNSSPVSIEKVFELELECWCYGLSHFKGELTSVLVQRVIKDLTPTFQAAILQEYNFDICKVSRQLAAASGFVVEEVDAALGILVSLPHPSDLDEGAQYVMARILEHAEAAYGPVLELLEPHWQAEKRKLDRLRSRSALPSNASGRRVSI